MSIQKIRIPFPTLGMDSYSPFRILVDSTRTIRFDFKTLILEVNAREMRMIPTLKGKHGLIRVIIYDRIKSNPKPKESLHDEYDDNPIIGLRIQQSGFCNLDKRVIRIPQL